MTDKEFQALTDTFFERLARALDGSDADLVQTGSGVFEIEFDNAESIVVNRHAPSREIWVAARSGAHHFRWNGEDWRDTRSDETIRAVLSGMIDLRTEDRR
ncbi:MAG: iron donor protein CyaY [Candidatus Accumulibacter sp.]|jgi:iron donor protein CyaY|nr:iron donor protein CyaY [Accumulibacter sp.]